MLPRKWHINTAVHFAWWGALKGKVGRVLLPAQYHCRLRFIMWDKYIIRINTRKRVDAYFIEMKNIIERGWGRIDVSKRNSSYFSYVSYTTTTATTSNAITKFFSLLLWFPLRAGEKVFLGRSIGSTRIIELRESDSRAIHGCRTTLVCRVYCIFISTWVYTYFITK